MRPAAPPPGSSAATTPGAGVRDGARRTARRLRRGLLAQRRLLAAGCVTVAVLATVQALAAPPPERTPVVTVTRDLPAGHRLTAADLRRTDYPPAAVPGGATTGRGDALQGRRLAAPVRRGEPVTDRSLVGPGLATGHPGLQATPVRLSDAAVAGLLRVGQRINLLAADADGSRVLARCAPVLALPGDGSAGATRTSGRVVVLGLGRSEARAAAPASAQSYLSFAYCREESG